MSRTRIQPQVSAAAEAAIDNNIDDLDAYLNEVAAEPEESAEPAHQPPAEAFNDSLGAFRILRGLISESPRRQQASALFNGRYRSGVFTEGREALYPYLGARRIYPQDNLSVKQKLDYIQSLLPSPVPQTDLLVIDLARLAIAAGITLPPDLEPESLKATLTGRGTSNSPTNEFGE